MPAPEIALAGMLAFVNSKLNGKRRTIRSTGLLRPIRAGVKFGYRSALLGLLRLAFAAI